MALALALEALLLIGVAALAALALPRAATARHRLWRWTVAALLLLPVSQLLPAIATFEIPAPLLGGAGAATSTGGPFGAPAALGRALIALWALGATALLLRVAGGLASAARSSASARIVVDPVLLAEVAAVERALGLRPRARLRFGAAGAVPYAFGFGRPQLVLPADAGRWSASERRAVLLHELAHVGRRDWLWQLLASIATALYWPLPPVWWLASRLQLDGERACDQAVLRAGVPASAYAALLLGFARRRRRPAVVALVSRSQLGRRIATLLEPRPAVSAHPAWPLALLALATAALIGLQPQLADPTPTPPDLRDPLALIGPEATPSGSPTLACDAVAVDPDERCRVLVIPTPDGAAGLRVVVRGDGAAPDAAFAAALAEIEAELRRRYADALEPHLPTWVEEQEFGL